MFSFLPLRQGPILPPPVPVLLCSVLVTSVSLNLYADFYSVKRTFYHYLDVQAFYFFVLPLHKMQSERI
jgi:hypothetical protein